MQLSIDWKFISIAVATFAGVIVPLWLWQKDHSAQALELRIVSVSSIQPQEQVALKGLKLSLDGKDVNHGYIAVLELLNTGSQPLPLAAYEAPIEITTLAASRVLRAEVSATVPSDIRPQVSTSGSVISIQPLLLNPTDKIQLTILTDGATPVFSARARIAGVPSVEVSAEPGDIHPKREAWVMAVMGVLLLFVYTFVAFGAFGRVLVIGRAGMFVAAFICGVAAALLILPIQHGYGLSALQFWPIPGVAVGVAGAVVLLLDRIHRRAP